jgi:hypothetical protein
MKGQKKKYLCNETALHELFRPYEEDLYQVLGVYYPAEAASWISWYTQSQQVGGQLKGRRRT